MLVWGCFLANVVIFLSLSVYLCSNMCFEGSILTHLEPHFGQTDSILDSFCSNARPIFLFTPPIQQTCAPFWYIFFATLYQKTPRFLCFTTCFWQKNAIYVLQHTKKFGRIRKKQYLCRRKIGKSNKNTPILCGKSNKNGVFLYRKSNI